MAFFQALNHYRQKPLFGKIKKAGNPIPPAFSVLILHI